MSVPRNGRLPISLKLAFAAPAFAGAAMAIPIAIHMPRFYSDVVLVPLGTVAVAIALARALDAFTDPVIGWLSDRTRTRWGRRKPYIAVGAPLCALAFLALFAPPARLEPDTAGIWFGVTFALYFLFHTIYVIPHGALGAEVSLDYHERSNLFGIQSMCIAAGTIVAAVLPGVVEDGLGVHDERRIFAGLAAGYGVLMVGLYAIMLLRVPERAEFASRAPNPLVPGVRRALRNRPFRILFLAALVNAVPVAVPATLVPYFTYYVVRPERPATWLAIFLLLYLGAGFLCLPGWMALARRWGKLPTLITCASIGISGSVTFFAVGPGDTTLAASLYCYTGISSAALGFLLPAMGADVIDYDELCTGRRREAQFGAFWSIIPKFVAIPGSSVPIAVLSAVGYVPNEIQTPAVVLTIRVLYALFPAVFYVASLLILVRYPISERVHRAIRLGIAAHGRGESAQDPLTGEMLPPAAARPVDDATGWFLDHFSVGELRRSLQDGCGRVLRDVLVAVAAALGTSLGLVWVALASVTDGVTRGASAGDPLAAAAVDAAAPVTVVAIVGAGLALTALSFQLLRLRPAWRLAQGPVPAETIRAHLRGVPGVPSRDLV